MPLEPVTLDGEVILQPKPLLIVISGPSGVGKDAVLKSLKERNLPLHFVVTATSRAPRNGEVEGVDYFFVSKTQFEAMIHAGELLEYSTVYLDYKGVPKKQVMEAMASGKDVVLRVDFQGAEKIRRLYPDALLIFITTRSRDELSHRLIDRKTESEESIAVRQNALAIEIKSLPTFDYLVVNNQGRLQETVDQIVDIIRVEHSRIHPREVTL